MTKRKLIFLLCLFFAVSMSSFAQERQVKGKVVELETGEPLPGATVLIENSTRGVTTDVDGTFEIRVSPTSKLVISFIGMQSESVMVGDKTFIEVGLKLQTSELDEVTVVAFGKQKKESVTAAITTVRPDELKVPSSNLTTALAGRMSGLISYQRSGEPGEDDASFFIRGVTTLQYGAGPLILIDGLQMPHRLPFLSA